MGTARVPRCSWGGGHFLTQDSCPCDIVGGHMRAPREPWGSGDACGSSKLLKAAKETPLDRGEGSRCMSSLTNEVAESCGMPCDSCRRGLCASARAGLSHVTGAKHWSLSRATWKLSLLSPATSPAVKHAVICQGATE